MMTAVLAPYPIPILSSVRRIMCYFFFVLQAFALYQEENQLIKRETEHNLNHQL